MKFLKFGDSKNYIVFLHGWGADKNSMLWLRNYFEEYSTVFVDFFGFGESKEPDKPFFVEDYSLALKKILEGFEIESLTLVGHSFGGRVSIKFASLFENDYKRFRLCLVDSAGIKPRRKLNYYFKVLNYKICKKRARTSEKAREKLSKFGSEDYKKLSPIMKQTFVNVVNEDLSGDTKMIKCDTCIIWGEKDTETKLFMAKKLYKFISNSDLFVLKGAGHFSFLDKPKEFLYILDTFLKKQ